MSHVNDQSLSFQNDLACIMLIQVSAVLDLTEDDFDFLTSNKFWIPTDRNLAQSCHQACNYGKKDIEGYPHNTTPEE